MEALVTDSADHSLPRPFVFVLASLLLFGIYLAYPCAVTIEDEVYYLGHAHAISHGRLIPSVADPYPDISAAGRVRIKYPSGWPMLLAPAMRYSPHLALAMNGLFHLLSMGVFALLLKRRKLSMGYSFLYLLQPGLLLYSRTAVAEGATLFLILSGLWAVEARRYFWAGAILGLALSVRLSAFVVGGTLAAALIFQALLRRRPWGEPISYLGGYCLTAGLAPLNYWLTQGTFWPRVYLTPGTASFAPELFGSHLLFYVAILSLLYPGMLLGFFKNTGLERTVVLAVILFQSLYFFVDTGRLWFETLVIGQRLVLPAVVILLLGYAEWLEEIRRRWFRWLPHLVCSAAGVSLLLIAIRLGNFQKGLADVAREIDKHIPAGATLEYDPLAMKLVPLLSAPLVYKPVDVQKASPHKEATYYLLANQILSYRLRWTLPPRTLPYPVLIHTDLATLYQIPPSGS